MVELLPQTPARAQIVSYYSHSHLPCNSSTGMSQDSPTFLLQSTKGDIHPCRATWEFSSDLMTETQPIW